MNWSVTYRAKDGGQTIETIEAESRSEVFAILANRGISAIKVAEAGTTGKSRRKIPVRCAAWVACVVAIAALGFFAFKFLMNEESKVETVKTEKPKRITEVKPAAPAPQEVIPEEPKPPVRATDKGTPIPDNVHPDERGIMRYPNGQRWVDPNDLHIVKHPQKRKLFKRTCDNQLAIMLTLDPTKMAPFLVGKRRPYGDSFIKDFHDSLYEKYEPDPDDTEEEAAVRQMVIETRAELKAAMDRGEDIAKLMNATQEELDRLCQYQDALKKELQAIQYDENVTDEDFEDFVKAANIMLEKQGLKGLTMPHIVTRQARIKKMKELLSRKENTNE